MVRLGLIPVGHRRNVILEWQIPSLATPAEGLHRDLQIRFKADRIHDVEAVQPVPGARFAFTVPQRIPEKSREKEKGRLKRPICRKRVSSACLILHMQAEKLSKPFPAHHPATVRSTISSTSIPIAASTPF